MSHSPSLDRTGEQLREFSLIQLHRDLCTSQVEALGLRNFAGRVKARMYPPNSIKKKIYIYIQLWSFILDFNKIMIRAEHGV